ncbi:hypothetical protein R3P38DRAFT_2798710 [Favolaschia claudopus]|uniref:Uncharacterized protein n=1 Tax=Favolaschia claudopus TaxID=2862362 RepID=A0AAW0A121_9AGAR
MIKSFIYRVNLDQIVTLQTASAQGIFTKVAEHYEHFETISFWLLGSRQRALISRIKQNEVLSTLYLGLKVNTVIINVFNVEYTDTFVANRSAGIRAAFEQINLECCSAGPTLLPRHLGTECQHFTRALRRNLGAIAKFTARVHPKLLKFPLFPLLLFPFLDIFLQFFWAATHTVTEPDFGRGSGPPVNSIAVNNVKHPQFKVASSSNMIKSFIYRVNLDQIVTLQTASAQGIFTKVAEHYEHFETISFWLLGSRQRALISRIKQNEVLSSLYLGLKVNTVIINVFNVEYTDTFVANRSAGIRAAFEQINLECCSAGPTLLPRHLGTECQHFTRALRRNLGAIAKFTARVHPKLLKFPLFPLLLFPFLDIFLQFFWAATHTVTEPDFGRGSGQPKTGCCHFGSNQKRQ